MSWEGHLHLYGSGPRLGELALRLQAAGFWVTLAPESESGRTHEGLGLAFLVAVDSDAELERLAARAQAGGRPWLVSCGPAAGPELATAAYRHGALAVLPADAPLELVQRTIERTHASLRPAAGEKGAAERRRLRRFRPGDAIALAEDELLLVSEGVVAQFALHEDGVESLLGLWGPDQILSGHPEDACCLSLRAHTAVTVEIGRWSELSRRREVIERLWQRLLRLEAWSSMQSRQNIELRLLGILSLLAEQFGRPHAEGILVDVKVTHAQLAAAIGATRATVTRVLGVLRRRGALHNVGRGGGERFCLAGWQRGSHSHPHRPGTRRHLHP